MEIVNEGPLGVQGFAGVMRALCLRALTLPGELTFSN